MSSKVINSICGGGSGGSASLNFSVHNYSAEKTAAGSTNEIQVYPVTTMNSWKIQSTAPESPTLNDVWLQTGTGRYEFQPVSGTPLYTAVSGASLWDGSSWVSKSTKCYYDGAWNPSWAWVLYENGIQYVTFSSYQYSESYSSTPTFGSSYIQLDANNSETRRDGIQFSGVAEIPSGATKLLIKHSSVSTESSNARYYFAFDRGNISSYLPNTGDLSTVTETSFSLSSAATELNTIKINFIPNSVSGSGSATCRIHKIYFE